MSKHFSYAADKALAQKLATQPASAQTYFRVVNAMAAEAARHGRRFVNPSIAAMMALTGYSRRTIQRAKKSLVAAGLLIISQAYRFVAGFAIRCRDRLTLTLDAGAPLRPGANALGLRERHDTAPVPQRPESRLYRYLMERTAPLRATAQLALPLPATAAPMGDSDGTARSEKDYSDLASRSVDSIEGFRQRRLQRLARRQ